MNRKRWLAFGLILTASTGLFTACESDDDKEAVGEVGQDKECKLNSTCDESQVCSGKACKNYSGVRYEFAITAAQASDKNSKDDDWDALGGKPDLKVCLYVSDTQLGCTTVADDTTAATWSWKEEANIYSNDSLTLQLVDADLGGDAEMATKEYNLVSPLLHAGGDIVMWNAGSRGNTAMTVTWTVTAL